jgi:hypothetical protein
MRITAIAVLALLTLMTSDASRQSGNSKEHLEGKLIRMMDELDAKDSIGIYGDIVTLDKVETESVEPSEESVDPLVSRIERFLRTRKVEVSLPDDTSTAGLFGRALGQRNIDIELRSLARGTSEGK